MDRLFTTIASKCAHAMGEPLAFIISTLLVVLWAVAGPVFHYSDTWQLVINTATTVLTFLAVFLIQNSQNRDGAAIQAKLDEILRAIDTARDLAKANPGTGSYEIRPVAELYDNRLSIERKPAA